MFSDTIKRIERQYEIKRNKADALFVEEKKAIYDKTPRLSEIDKKNYGLWHTNSKTFYTRTNRRK